MVIRIVSLLCIVIGTMGLISLVYVEDQDTYYAHIAMSLGFMVVGIGMMTMAIREYRGGAATIIAIIMSFFAFTSLVSQLEAYIRYREYEGSGSMLVGTLVLMALALFVAGHRTHRMQRVIDARLKESSNAD
jgi:uncharacterized membrane protein YkgB